MAAPASAQKYLESEGVNKHLEALVQRLVSEQPKDAYALVEVISRLVKNPTEDPIVVVDEDQKARADYSRLVRGMLSFNKEEEMPAIGQIPDLMEDARLLSWAGIGFSETEAYKVMCSMRKFARDNAAITKMRFWGKLLGTERDYYIIEAVKEPEGDQPEDQEVKGAWGVNKFTYFVTGDLAAEAWLELEDLRPDEVKAARQIKRLLSGRLDSKVIVHPFLPGKVEKKLLRAQIARISADATLCPKGFLVVDPDDPQDPDKVLGPKQVIEAEEFEFPATTDLCKQEFWTHCLPQILSNGRTSLVDPEIDLDAAPERAKEQDQFLELKENTRILEINRPIVGDGLGWVIRQAGDTTLYKPEAPAGEDDDGNKKEAKPKSNAVVSLRSLKWPGALCVAQGTRFINFYVGYGLPAGESDFFPREPLDIQDEPEDVEEQAEPSGSHDTGDAGGDADN